MNIKKTSDLLLNFAIKRLAEIFGILVSLTGLMLFLSLITYSPNDPNFIFPENTKIENLMGFQGSFISDLFFQSVGIMAYLIPLTFLVTGINILRSKDFFLFIENNFFTILYLIFGALFFGYYYSDTYSLYINGNSGFVGEYLNKSFLGSTISINENIFFYILILIIIIFFFISVNFNLKKFFEFIKKTYDLINKRNTKNYTDKSEIINEYIPQDEIKNLIQEDLPFIKSENKSELKIKFKLPGLDLLKIPTKKERENFEKNEAHDPEFLEKILMDFGVSGNIKKVSHGPVVTLNEFEPAAGVKVSKIINLSDDIARNTSSESARIATIPGSNTVGIELPNNIRENVYLSEILSNTDFKKKDIKLPIALGKNISGKPIVGDLASMPHLLISGTTGSGKSVCINTIILSLLYRHTPDKCKFILIDPKMLELSVYDGIPHLLTPVITDMKDAGNGLRWCVAEMERRYKLMSLLGVRNLAGYNRKVADAEKVGTPIDDPLWQPDPVLAVTGEEQTAPALTTLPSIVVVIDEFAAMMMIVGNEVAELIPRIAHKARAAGIHLVLATQRPSVDVITGLIKANIPSRVAFSVSSKIDSRTILDQGGAEQLLGYGDMLYLPSGSSTPTRVHGAFCSDEEVHRVVADWRRRGTPDFIEGLLDEGGQTPVTAQELQSAASSDDDPESDALYDEAVHYVCSSRRASISSVQRKLRIGYNRAARLIETMEATGVVTPMGTNGQREVLAPPPPGSDG